jgi:hypothetical protein
MVVGLAGKSNTDRWWREKAWLSRVLLKRENDNYFREECFRAGKRYF